MRRKQKTVAVAALILAGLVFGIYRYVARNTKYHIQAHVCVEGFTDLMLSASGTTVLNELFGKRGIGWGRTIDGVRIEPSLIGARFTASGNYWNYEERARTARRLLLEFVDRNPTLMCTEADIRVTEVEVGESHHVNPPVVLEEKIMLSGNQSAQPPPPIPGPSWQMYSPADKKFHLEFPGTPEPWNTEFESPKYGQTEVYHVSVESNGMLLGVNYNDYPRELTDSEVQAELKIAYTLPDTGAEILETSEVEVADVPAIEVISKTGPIYMVGRYFITDSQRLYSLQCGSTRDVRNDRREIDRFFDSFHLAGGADTESSDQAE